MTASDGSPNALTAYLAEYDALTGEINTRFESQRLSFTLTVTLLGAAVAALTSDHISSAAARTAVLLAIPIFVAPAAAIFFDNEIMIYRLATRISQVLQPAVARLTDRDDVLGGHDYNLFGITRWTQHGLSFGRWILFIGGPIISTFLLATQRSYFPLSSYPASIAFYLDIVLDVGLLWAMGVAAYVQITASSMGVGRSAMHLPKGAAKI